MRRPFGQPLSLIMVQDGLIFCNLFPSRTRIVMKFNSTRVQASMLSLAALLAFCSKKKEEVAPPSVEEKPPVTETVCLGNKTTYLAIRAASGAPQTYECSIAAGQTSDTLYLDVKSTVAINYLYITVSADNGASVPLLGKNALLTDDKKTIAIPVDTTYSYGIPSLSSFKLKVPVVTRTVAGAAADVYTIWATSGKGHFAVTGKKTIVGPVSAKLNYKANIPFVTVKDIVIGDQTSGKPHFLAVEGKVGAVLESEILVNETSFADKQKALNSVDLNILSLNLAKAPAKDSAYGNVSSNCGSITGAKTYLVGTGLRNKLGKCLTDAQGNDSTKLAVYSGSATFESFDGEKLKGLAAPTLDRVEIGNGGLFVFMTSDGRKGIVQVKNYTKSPGELKAKMLVDVKVLVN